MALSQNQKNPGRKSIALIAAICAETMAANPSYFAVVNVTVVDKKKLKFTAEAVIGDGTIENDKAYVVATNDGKVKRYSDLDSVCRSMAVIAPASFGDGVDSTKFVIRFKNALELLPAENISGDPSEKLVKESAKLTAANVTLNQKVTAIGVDIAAVAAYATGTPKQQAFYNELVAEKTVMEQLVELNAARIAAIAVILA